MTSLLPASFSSRMETQLGAEYADFLKALSGPSPTSIRYNTAKYTPSISKPIPWCSVGSYLETRPIFTLDPLFHGGGYYVQEASSMVLWSILEQIYDHQPWTALDLCAAPGGKSTLLSSFLSTDSLLISNEIIPKRASILAENVAKWGNPNTLVTQNKPSDFTHLQETFDLVLLDAPCSGEGLFRKDSDAISEWNESSNGVCSARQQEIWDTIQHTLKPGGYLIYSTCTYSPLENDAIVSYILSKGTFEIVEINIEPSWGMVKTNGGGVQCYPHRCQGEGFYVALLQRKGNLTPTIPLKIKTKLFNSKPFSDWIADEFYAEGEFYQEAAGILFRNHRSQAFLENKNVRLHFKKSGVRLGEIAGKDVIPDAEWALVRWPSKKIKQTELTQEEALAYLKKDNFHLPVAEKGWQLATYQGLGLGWFKHLGNRTNNYFPTEWRIRMDIPIKSDSN